MFYCRKLKPPCKYFKYRFIFTDKICCLRLFDISRNFLIKASIEQELYTCKYPYLLFLECTFQFFFEYSEVPYLLSAWELVHFLLWSWPCKSSPKIKIPDGVCSPLLSNLSSRMSFTEVLPGRISLPVTFLVLHSKQESSCVCMETPTGCRVRRGGHEFHWCPFLGWRPDGCILMAKGLTAARCSPTPGWTQGHSAWLPAHLLLQGEKAWRAETKSSATQAEFGVPQSCRVWQLYQQQGSSGGAQLGCVQGDWPGLCCAHGFHVSSHSPSEQIPIRYIPHLPTEASLCLTQARWWMKSCMMSAFSSCPLAEHTPAGTLAAPLWNLKLTVQPLPMDRNLAAPQHPSCRVLLPVQSGCMGRAAGTVPHLCRGARAALPVAFLVLHFQREQHGFVPALFTAGGAAGCL